MMMLYSRNLQEGGWFRFADPLENKVYPGRGSMYQNAWVKWIGRKEWIS